jgi:hypothetical protein
LGEGNVSNLLVATLMTEMGIEGLMEKAEAGDSDAQIDLGFIFSDGRGIPREFTEAANRKAAERGIPQAQYNLGIMYDNGRGVPQDYAEAAKWYRKAAEQGDESAQLNLGCMYDKGEGVPQDYAEAAKWYRKAAEQGDANAQLNLGFMYDKGQGVPQDYAEAAKWYRKAAEQGNALAQDNLGLCYADGLGVPQDYAEAAKWYRKAAEHGKTKTLHNLGQKMGLALRIIGFGLFIVYGFVQIYAGYIGIDHHLGGLWAALAIVAAVIFRFTLPITIGSFFGAMNVWGWHWVGSAFFAAPGLLLVVPGVLASILSMVWQSGPRIPFKDL